MSIFQLPKTFSVQSDGTPYGSAKLYFYRAGTTTDQIPYTDSALTVPHAQPVVADTAGIFPVIYLNPSESYDYRIQLKTSADVLIYDQDNIPRQADGINSTLVRYDRTAAEITAGVTPVNYYYKPGSWQRYGADPSGVSDSTSAINNALACNADCFDEPNALATYNSYKITGVLRFKMAGQKLRGIGFGDANTVGGAGAKYAPRTFITYTGSAGGKMLSVCDGSVNLSETQVLDLVLDGNNLATKVYEGYDDTYAGGCWRNLLQNVGILNGTSGTGYGLYLGAGTGNNNANDININNAYVYNCDIGLTTGGATTRIHQSTFQGCTTCGINMSTGAMVFASMTVFTGNAWDILGVTHQMYSSNLNWYENSSQGIYKPTTSHIASFVGDLLHTSNVTRLIDWNSAAGNASIIACTVGTTTASSAVKNHNVSYEYSYIGSGVTPDNDYRLRLPYSGVGQNGLVRIDQADFMCGLASDATNATGDGTTFNLNASAVTEDHDLNSALAASTGIFTAPAAGFYEFFPQVSLGNLGAAHTDAILSLVVTGTAQTYTIARCNPGAIRNSSNEVVFGAPIRVGMAKNDTAYMAIYVSGSTKTVTVQSGASGSNWRTRFQGRLA